MNTHPRVLLKIVIWIKRWVNKNVHFLKLSEEMNLSIYCIDFKALFWDVWGSATIFWVENDFESVFKKYEVNSCYGFYKCEKPFNNDNLVLFVLIFNKFLIE